MVAQIRTGKNRKPNIFCLYFLQFVWYTPAEQPSPNPVEANKVLAIDKSVKWSSRQTDPTKQR